MVESSQERAKRNKYRRKKAMLKKVHKKAGIAFLCVMAALAVLAGRIAWINYNHGDAYSKAVLDHQTYTSTTIPYKRGTDSDLEWKYSCVQRKSVQPYIRSEAGAFR